MKTMKKLLCLAIVAVMVLGAAVTAFAADPAAKSVTIQNAKYDQEYKGTGTDPQC